MPTPSQVPHDLPRMPHPRIGAGGGASAASLDAQCPSPGRRQDLTPGSERGAPDRTVRRMPTSLAQTKWLERTFLPIMPHPLWEVSSPPSLLRYRDGH
jgi:hypothetical protein